MIYYQEDYGGEMKKSDLIYGVSIGAAFYLTGINILVEFIPDKKIFFFIGIILVVFGGILPIITLILYVNHREDKNGE